MTDDGLRTGWRESAALREVIRHLTDLPGFVLPDDGGTGRLIAAALSGRAPCPDCSLGFVLEHMDGAVVARSTCPRCDGLMFVPEGDPERGHPDVDPSTIGELVLLEEVCALYSRDEDRFVRSDGTSEPYGSVPVEAGLKARSARTRFDAREAEAERAERLGLEEALRTAATPEDREVAIHDLAMHDEVAGIRAATRAGHGPLG